MRDASLHSHRAQVVVDGKRLEIITHEPTSAWHRTIVMLHEGLGSVAQWKTFPEQLARHTGARVMAYSRYGYGHSDVLTGKRNVDYMHHEGEVVLPALLAHLEIERPILFGHSDGASIALIYGGAHPDRVEGLVLEAPHVFVEDHSIRGIAAAAETYRNTDLATKLGRYHRDVDRTFWGWNDIWLDPRFRTWNVESYVARVTAPTFVLQGNDDEYGTIAQPKAIAALIADATTIVLENCAHAPHRDRTQATLDASADFVMRLETGYI